MIFKRDSAIPRDEAFIQILAHATVNVNAAFQIRCWIQRPERSDRALSGRTEKIMMISGSRNSRRFFLHSFFQGTVSLKISYKAKNCGRCIHLSQPIFPCHRNAPICMATFHFALSRSPDLR